MLGEKLGDAIGQVTGVRVLPSDAAPKVEVSFQQAGTLLGRHFTDMGTYVSTGRPDGTLQGDGQGVIMTEDGDLITWRGGGVGTFTGQGTAIRWRGAVYYSTTSERLARLNGVACLFEFDVDESNKIEATLYEWK